MCPLYIAVYTLFFFYTLIINDNIKILSDSYIESIINSIMMSIMNEMYSNPSQYNQYIIMLLTNPNEYPNEVLLDSIKNINSKMVRKYLERLFNAFTFCSST